MKRTNVILMLMSLAGLIGFSSCEHDVSVVSEYHADGSLDRTFSFSRVDSAFAFNNYYGVSPQAGWQVETLEADTANNKSSGGKYSASLRKHFPDVESANAEMDNETDTLFHIHSAIEKRHTLFYTYTRYTDTYRAMNPFIQTPVGDYFTQEDFAFISRLPSEGSLISKADSFHLKRLNESIEEHYATEAIYNEVVDALLKAMAQGDDERRYMDTLLHHRQEIMNNMIQGDKDPEDILLYADSLGIPLSDAVKSEFELESRTLEKRINFISSVYSALYVHAMALPDGIVNSNADSLAGTAAYWKPPALKFLLKDYEMYAETRSLNPLSLAGLFALIGLTIFVFVRRKRRA